jgi:hypothetical protein
MRVRIWLLSLCIGLLLSGLSSFGSETPPEPANPLVKSLAEALETRWSNWSFSFGAGMDSRVATAGAGQVYNLQPFDVLSARIYCDAVPSFVRLRWRLTSRLGGLYET